MSASPPPVLHPFALPALAAGRYVEIVRGQGCLVWDCDGKEYLDGTASLWYCMVGHGRSEIADAVARQMGQIAAYQTFSPFTNRPSLELAEAILARAPLPDGRVFFTSGGSEAVDSALKIARVAHFQGGEPERVVILSRCPSYHGVTFGALSATGLALNRQGFGPLVGAVHQAPHDDLLAMREAVADHGPDRIAAIIAEPVIGAGGLYPPAPGYLEGLRELCDECGAFLILDEVITGFGRLGSWFGAQHFGVTPDLLTFAKGVTSGYLPVGGVVLGRRVCELLERDGAFLFRHGTTYAAHPTCCAAGVANIAILERERLPDRAAEAGFELRAALEQLAGHPLVAEVRGVGLMQAIALVEGADAVALAGKMLELGLIGRPIPSARVVAFSPALVIDDGQIDRLADLAGQALAGMPAPA